MAAHRLTSHRCRLGATGSTPHTACPHHGRPRSALRALLAGPRDSRVADRLRPCLTAHGLTRHRRSLGTLRAGLTAHGLRAHGSPLGPAWSPRHPLNSTRYSLRHSWLSTRPQRSGLDARRLARLIAAPGQGRIPDSLGAGLAAHGLAAHRRGLGTLRARLAAHGLAAHCRRLGTLRAGLAAHGLAAHRRRLGTRRPRRRLLARGGPLVPGGGRRLTRYLRLSRRSRETRHLARPRRRLLRALQHRNRALPGLAGTTHVTGLNAAALSAKGCRLNTVLAAHLRALLRGLLGGRLHRIGGGGRRGAAHGGTLLCDLLRRGGFVGHGLRRVLAAHDGGKIQRLDLRRLIPGMPAAGALQRPALLPQKFGWQFKMGRAVRARNTHS